MASYDCYGNELSSDYNTNSSQLMLSNCAPPTAGTKKYNFTGAASYEYTEYGTGAANPTISGKTSSGEPVYCDATLNPNSMDYDLYCCPVSPACTRPKTDADGNEIYYQSRPAYLVYKQDGSVSIKGNLVNAGESTYLKGGSNIKDKNGTKMTMVEGDNSVEATGEMKVGDSMVFNDAEGKIQVGKDNSISKAGGGNIVQTDLGGYTTATFNKVELEGEVSDIDTYAGSYYYTDKSSKKIVKMETDGSTTEIGEGNNFTPEGIKVKSDWAYVTSSYDESLGGNLDMFLVTSPTEDSVYNMNDSIFISWTKLMGAMSYNVLHEDSKGIQREISVIPGNTSYSFAASAEYPGLNYFSVTAHDANGKIIGRTNNNVSVYVGNDGQRKFRMLTPTHRESFKYDQLIRFSWTKLEEANEYYLFCKKDNSDDPTEADTLEINSSTGYRTEFSLATGDKPGELSDGYYECRVFAKFNGTAINSTIPITVEVRGELRLPPGVTDADYATYCASNPCPASYGGSGIYDDSKVYSAASSFSPDYYYLNSGQSNPGTHNVMIMSTNGSTDAIKSFYPDPGDLRSLNNFNIVKEFLESKEGGSDKRAMNFTNPKGLDVFEGHVYVADSGNNRIVRIKDGLAVPDDLGADLMRVKAENGAGWTAYVNSALKARVDDYWSILDTGDYQMNNPQDINFNSTGIYIANTGNKQIVRYHAGQWMDFAGWQGNWTPSSVSWDGNVFVTDADAGEVYKIHVNLVYDLANPNAIWHGMVYIHTYMVYGRKGTEDFEFNHPAAIAGIDGQYVVADTYGDSGVTVDVDDGSADPLLTVQDEEEYASWSDANSNVYTPALDATNVNTLHNGNPYRLKKWKQGKAVAHCATIGNDAMCTTSGCTNCAPSDCNGQWDLEPVINECSFWTDYACCTIARDGIQGMNWVSNWVTVVDHYAGDPILDASGNPTGSYYASDVTHMEDHGSMQCTGYCCVENFRNCLVGYSVGPEDYAVADSLYVGDGSFSCSESGVSQVKGWPLEGTTGSPCL